MFHSYIIELHAQAIAVTSYCLEEAFSASSSTGTLDFGSACRACSDMFRSICYLNWLFRSVSCNSFDTSSYDHQRIQLNQLNPPWKPLNPLRGANSARASSSSFAICTCPCTAAQCSGVAPSTRVALLWSAPPWRGVSCSTHETGWLFEQ